MTDQPSNVVPLRAELWTIQHVADFLQKSVSWVYRAAAAGKLPATKLGGEWRFVPADIRALIGKQRD